MKSFRINNGNTVWLDNEELGPLYDFLVEYVDLLDGSLLFDELVDAYNDVNEALRYFKEEKEEEIAELELEMEG